MHHVSETTPGVAILTNNADYFAMLKHILLMEGIRAILCTQTDIDHKSEDRNIAGLIIDVEDDGQDAIATCKRIRSRPGRKGLEILALIPNGRTDIYMDLIRAGADHCLTRPFWPPLLLTFLQDISPIKLPRSELLPSDTRLKLGDIELWPERKRATVNGVELTLGPIEFKLLEHLLTDPGRIFSRGELIAAAWPHEIYVQPRTVDVHIGRIRRTLKRAIGSDVIRTARSSGYSIELARIEGDETELVS